jgi:TRAP-type mannitol/chloroaromatic compound transport system permease small subunit
VLFLLPLCGFLAWMALDFAAVSWSINESSREPGGLPYPMIPLLKSVVLIMPVFVALQGVSLLLRSLATLRGK